MRRRKTYVRKKLSLIKILMLILVLGVAVGTVVSNSVSETQSGTLSFITRGFIESRANQTFIQTFSASFFSASVFVMTAFFMGFCSIGQPFEIMLPFFKGLGLGISMAEIYSECGAKGAVICLAMIIPAALICSLIIIVASREALKLSVTFLGALKDKEMKEYGGDIIKKYLLKFTVLILAAAVSSFADSLLTAVFSPILL